MHQARFWSMGTPKEKYFPEQLPTDSFGYMTDHISNSRLYKKCEWILLSRATMRERLIWQGHVLWLRMIDYSIVLVGQPYRAKQTAICPQIGWEDVVRKDPREIKTSWQDIKRGALKRLGWRWSMYGCVGLVLQWAVSSSRLQKFIQDTIADHASKVTP